LALFLSNAGVFGLNANEPEMCVFLVVFVCLFGSPVAARVDGLCFNGQSNVPTRGP